MGVEKVELDDTAVPAPISSHCTLPYTTQTANILSKEALAKDEKSVRIIQLRPRWPLLTKSIGRSAFEIRPCCRRRPLSLQRRGPRDREPAVGCLMFVCTPHLGAATNRRRRKRCPSSRRTNVLTLLAEPVRVTNALKHAFRSRRRGKVMGHGSHWPVTLVPFIGQMTDRSR